MTTYTPRNDYVLVQLTEAKVSKGGVHIPEKSEESAVWHVVRTGPKVDGLCPGDQVMLMGTVGEDVARIPRQQGLFITKEANILLVIRQEEEASYPNSYDCSDMDI